MSINLNLTYDQGLIDQISHDFDLRSHNREALAALVTTLSGDYNRKIEQVADMATGSGKTYLMAALIEYLRVQGHRYVIIVTPGNTVHDKTVRNFIESERFISGAQRAPVVCTPSNMSGFDYDAGLVSSGNDSVVTIMNVQQILLPTDTDSTTSSGDGAVRKRMRSDTEDNGNVVGRFKSMDDLVIIADESHTYGSTAKKFKASIADLDPAAHIGLTATPEKGSHIVFHYPLYRAINEGFVKQPVLALRRGGYTGESKERHQLIDALSLLRFKEKAYRQYVDATPDATDVHPVLFVVCSDIEHSVRVSEMLAGQDFLGNEQAVLRVDSKSNTDEVKGALEDLGKPSSPVRVVVSVNMLKEGFDSKAIAVICALRSMASDVLTVQTMGRGLRLPFGKQTGHDAIDQLDIVSHQSFRKAMNDANVLRAFGLEDAAPEDSGAPVVKVEHAHTDPMPEATEGNQDYQSPEIEFIDSPDDFPEDTLVDRPVVGIREIPDQGYVAPSDDEVIPSVKSNEKFASVEIAFPQTIKTPVSITPSLGDIPDDLITESVKKVAGGEVSIDRESIGVVEGAARLSTRRQDRVFSEADIMDIDEAIAKITTLVRKRGTLPGTKESIEHLCSRFVRQARVDWTDGPYGTTSSAALVICTMFSDYQKKRAERIEDARRIRRIGISTAGFVLPQGTSIIDSNTVSSRSDFVRGAWYSGWNRCIHDTSSFDSHPEFALSTIMDTDLDITWWRRLYSPNSAAPSDEAKIALTNARDYYPDFLAKDSGGTTWIIEVKRDDFRDDSDTLAKRDAAKSLVNTIMGGECEEFSGEKWGYALVFAGDIVDSSGRVKPISWGEMIKTVGG